METKRELTRRRKPRRSGRRHGGDVRLQVEDRREMSAGCRRDEVIIGRG